LAELEVSDSGKNLTESTNFMKFCAGFFKFYGEMADKVSGATFSNPFPGIQTHTQAEPGEVVTKETYYKIGHVNVTPSETGSNGILVSLKNGSTWNVTGTSYITSLTVDDDSSVVVPGGMKITVNGEETSPDALKGKTVTGSIVIAE
jgi:hypothetical protein